MARIIAHIRIRSRAPAAKCASVGQRTTALIGTRPKTHPSECTRVHGYMECSTRRRHRRRHHRHYRSRTWRGRRTERPVARERRPRSEVILTANHGRTGANAIIDSRHARSAQSTSMMMCVRRYSASALPLACGGLLIFLTPGAPQPYGNYALTHAHRSEMLGLGRLPRAASMTSTTSAIRHAHTRVRVVDVPLAHVRCHDVAPCQSANDHRVCVCVFVSRRVGACRRWTFRRCVRLCGSPDRHAATVSRCEPHYR